MSQQIQKKTWMGKTQEDRNGLKLDFLKTVQPNRISKFIAMVSNFKYEAYHTHVCHTVMILSFASYFFANIKFCCE